MKKIFLSKKNLLRNLSFIKSKTKQKICAVVKANAYGHGVKEICSILKGKVEFFAVANLEEALQIRDFDSGSKILILGKCDDFVKASQNNISVTIFNNTELNSLIRKLKKIEKINIHIKLNTGMNRIGFSKLENFTNAVAEMRKHVKINIEGIFTHFATLRNDIPFFRTQQKNFEDFVKVIPNDIHPIIHGGGSFTMLYTNNYDMIRVGIFLYGYGTQKLKPVLSVKTSIIHTDYILKDDYVGYSKSFIADSNMKIGVIPLGYNDGIPRSFIGKYLYSKKIPLKILSVCMDMTILQIPEKLKENSIVTVFDDASKWAKDLSTNEHDILVRFSLFRGERIVK